MHHYRLIYAPLSAYLCATIGLFMRHYWLIYAPLMTQNVLKNILNVLIRDDNDVSDDVYDDFVYKILKIIHKVASMYRNHSFLY
jgi:hypothetical protein